MHLGEWASAKSGKLYQKQKKPESKKNRQKTFVMIVIKDEKRILGRRRRRQSKMKVNVNEFKVKVKLLALPKSQVTFTLGQQEKKKTTKFIDGAF